MRCPRCHAPNSAGLPHAFASEPCSGIPRPDFIGEPRNDEERKALAILIEEAKP